MSNLKEESLQGAKWGLIQKLTLRPLQLLYGIALARLISPDEMGIMGLIAVFFAVAAQLKDCGFSTALLRKIDRTEADISTVFWTNNVINALLVLILFFLAPFIADWFRMPELVALTRVSAIMMLLNATAGVHWTLYTARRDFKTPAIVGLITTIVSMPVVFAFAWYGYSYWSIVIGNIVSSLISLITVWIISPWRPKWMFSWLSFKEFFAYGSKVMMVELVNTIYFDFRTILIGLLFNKASIALFSRGKHLAELAPSTVSSILSGVSFTILAQVQHDTSRMLHVYKKFVQLSSIITVWGCFAMLALSPSVIPLLYGMNWAACVPYVQVISLAILFVHLCTLNAKLLLILGHSGLVLKLEIVYKAIGLTGMLIASTMSVYAMCWAMVIGNFLALMINLCAISRKLPLSFFTQLRDIAPYYIYGAISCTPAFILSYTDAASHWLSISIGLPSAIFIYWVLMRKTKDQAYIELVKILEEKNILPRIRKFFRIT